MAAGASPDASRGGPAPDTPPPFDWDFLLKLVFISFGGAAAIKYGSLVWVPTFSPELTATLIFGPATAFTAYFLYLSMRAK